jgi:hypothetical protein
MHELGDLVICPALTTTNPDRPFVSRLALSAKHGVAIPSGKAIYLEGAALGLHWAVCSVQLARKAGQAEDGDMIKVIAEICKRAVCG